MLLRRGKMYFFTAILTVAIIISGMQLRNCYAASVNKITLNETNLIVGIGKYGTEKLEAKVTGSRKEIEFKSANPKIATVSKTGVVTGVSVGVTNITCTIKGTKTKAKCKVTVRNYVNSIECDNPYIDFYNKGDTYQIKLTVAPNDATINRVEYSVRDKSIATVSPNGLITAVGYGETRITVKAVDGSNKIAYIQVKLLNGQYDSPVGIAAKNKDNEHGLLKEVIYHSSFTGKDRKALVYTPPGYTTDKKYNVLYLCHGMGCDHTQWNGCGATNILDNLYAEGKAEDMILVMPNTYAAADDSKTGMNNGSTYEEFLKAYDDFEYELEQSLMPYIQKNYSVYTGPEHTAIAGLSMGGRETCNIGLKRTDLFSYMGMFSPAPTSDAKTSFTSVLDNEIHVKFPPKVIWLSVGSSDTVAGASTNDVKQALEQKEVQDYFKTNNVTYVYYNMPTPISHGVAEWQNGLYNFAQMIFK